MKITLLLCVVITIVCVSAAFPRGGLKGRVGGDKDSEEKNSVQKRNGDKDAAPRSSENAMKDGEREVEKKIFEKFGKGKFGGKNGEERKGQLGGIQGDERKGQFGGKHGNERKSQYGGKTGDEHKDGNGDKQRIRNKQTNDLSSERLLRPSERPSESPSSGSPSPRPSKGPSGSPSPSQSESPE